MFNTFLTESINELNEEIPRVQHDCRTVEVCNDILRFEHIDVEMVQKIIASFPNKISMNKTINLMTIRDSIQYIGHFLASLINESLTTASFPQQCEECRSIPRNKYTRKSSKLSSMVNFYLTYKTTKL